jgi:cell surface protein SprA
MAMFFTWLNQEQTTPFSEHIHYNTDFNTINEIRDTTPPDTGLPFPLPQDDPTQFYPPQTSPIHLSDPSIVKDTIIYDPESNEYVYYRKIGDYLYRLPSRLTFEEYQQKDFDKVIEDYWRERNTNLTSSGGRGFIPNITIPGKLFEGIFGSSTIDIRPQGTAELIFGVTSSRRDDPQLNVKQQRNTNFNFEEKIQMNVIAKVGDKIDFNVKYNTEASFEFENEMKLEYIGNEDEIIRRIEAGNVTLPLNSTLITGSQSLFGIKTEMQFGKTRVTSVISQQKGETSTITVAGGAQTSEYKLTAMDYEANKHFFISQYFYEDYDKFLSKLPIVNSPVNITKIEVWVTNIGPATTENRNIVAFMDLGEYDPYNLIIGGNVARLPNNLTNGLFNYISPDNLRDLNQVNNVINNAGLGLTSGIDFEKIENARKLQASEYTYNSKLGFISLNSQLNPDQVLAVAFQYTVIGDTTVYQVGEFSTDGIAAPQCLAVKLLKSTATNTKIPMWKLMMKNVYSIGGYQINSEDFQMHVTYKANETGIPMGYLTESDINGIPLIRVLNLDNLNTLNDPEPDGIFDFIDNAATMGGTIQSQNGRIFFPVTEPFGSYLRKKINNTALADKYCFDSLYTMTKTEARQYPNKNRFMLQGYFKSASGSEISLNAMNVPQGSVKVTAGGIPLTENVDFTVDYTLGRVKIINEGILNSGTPIQISLESQALFSIQTKTLIGTQIDHQLLPNLNLGLTIMNLNERPLTRKVNFGDEPISNTIWGFQVSYQTEFPFLTKALDFLPFYSTKAPSNINFEGEFAHLIPGHSRAIGSEGTAYIDDFEGSKSSIDIKNVGRWFLSSVPKGQPNWFPEADNDSLVDYGFNRALLAWYVIDPLFYRNNNLTPQHIKDDVEQLSNHYVREVLETEVFPNKENPQGLPLNIPVLNLSYYPTDKGPYNFDTSPSAISDGIDANGKLLNPQTRWAGMMRSLETTDFEETNVEYIEFWMMDPFILEPNHPGGYLVFNLGDISEDILHDNRKAFENGLPTGPDVINVDTTQWGRVPTIQSIVNAFDNNPVSRQYQDVGYDGLGDDDERSYFQGSYIDVIASVFGQGSLAYSLAISDPSKDNFIYFRGADLDAQQASILQRYKYYNGAEGNSPTSEQSNEAYPTSSSTLPNVEDINRDNTLTTTERYYQYIVELRPDKMEIGENYISDFFDATPRLRNGTTETVRWYQFKIPVKSPDQVVGNIQDYKSIRFMRLFLRGFSQEVTLRFATLDLVRSQWRRYEYSLLEPGEYIPDEEHNQTTFEISAVNIEENGNRTPIPYVLPPDIEREVNYGTTNLQRMNEQSLTMKVCHLVDGDARAIYKTADFDIRRYKRLKMYVHAEELNANEYTFNKGDLSLFIRLGTDFTENYYEYEIPLYPVSPNVGFDRRAIWPEDQMLDLEIQKFVELKKRRNLAMGQPNSTISLSTKYSETDGQNRISVTGAPNLSDVQTIMIGVRNPKKTTLASLDDGRPKCAEIWINELRLTDFDQKGGWAATARITANLADLGNISIAALHSTAGFGSIEKKINERQMEDITTYDIATNLELGKFLPEKAGIRIPMHYDISENFTNPQYNPLNPDILLKDDIRALETNAERDSLKSIVQDYTKRKSINFMNVSKMRTGEKASKIRLYDIENLDLSYAYTELYNRNIDIEYNLKKTYKFGLGYTYLKNPKNYKPLGKSKFLAKHKSLAIIRDFNFNLSPRAMSFRSEMDRQYQEQLMRNKTEAIILLEPNYMKTFNWLRFYNVKYDLTQSLKIDFTANAIARIDEPPGRISRDDPDYKVKRDSIWTNIMDFGRLTQYTQNYAVTYNLPINKIPLFNWVNVNTQYSGDFRWTAAPLYKDSLGIYTDHPFGNTIENNRTMSANLNTNMTNLYNKINYLKTLNQPARPQQQRPQPVQKGEEEDLDTPEPEKPKINYPKLVLDNTLKLLMSVKNVSGTYTISDGNLMPGFQSTPTSLGMDWRNNAPGLAYIFGSQEDIRGKLAEQGLLTKDTMLNMAHATKYSENLSLRMTIEPINMFKVEISATRSYSMNKMDYYRWDPFTQEFRSFTPTENGSFSVSIITWKTAFIKDAEDFSNENFAEFKKIRPEVAQHLAAQNPNWDGTYATDPLDNDMLYPSGFNSTSQDVLITSFLAAYTGQNFKKHDKLFSQIPLPNWRINYNGLSKVKFFEQYFRSVTMMHSYRSTYSIAGFNSNINFSDPDGDGFTWVKDQTGNVISQYEIGVVTINEQFSPLINLDFKWNQGMTNRIEIKKSRNLSLGLANHQLTEVSSNEYVFGIGYIFKELPISIKSGGGTRTFRSDLNVKLDFSIRNNKTILRKITEQYDQISAGQRVFTINASADYQLNERFTLRLYYDRIMNKPFISSQYPNRNTNAGLSVRFSLAQ